MTSDLAFRAAVKTVGEWAFRKGNLRSTPYPVIITLENHCRWGRRR
jgi:hypothetical protein